MAAGSTLQYDPNSRAQSANDMHYPSNKNSSFYPPNAAAAKFGGGPNSRSRQINNMHDKALTPFRAAATSPTLMNNSPPRMLQSHITSND